ncbi:proto-oncogene tyrosine-protein kinase ROS-like isoform X4 [Pomacea canaliculata]|uniref:proto-oncogene tyrosine-protein kinase ROS-like isoform X4 n=1 Tax=Pomacea canaliculata TaxID=400727 RepID=UPI000D72A1AD|nr:proto-oncogene tyrosine-protein kinase ROS-like isoform X4 [Pomacea canaliculata]
MAYALQIVILLQLFLRVQAIPDVDYIRNTCKGRCETSLIYSGQGSDLFCDDDCSSHQCHDGCLVFPSVLSSSCPQECSSIIQKKVNQTGQAAAQDEMKNCVQGCIFALDKYAEEMQDVLMPMPQPTLVRSTKGSTSVVLQWPASLEGNVTYLIHKKTWETSSNWQPHRNATFCENRRIKIEGLHPYVTYQFKVLAVVSPLQRHVFESPETVNITTNPSGVPASAPTITRLSAPSPTVISISWEPPVFPNGKLVGYKINLDPVGHPEVPKTMLEVPENLTSWTFSQCQSSQLYRFTLSAWNAFGMGPSDTANITTPNPGNLSASETPYLIFGAENKVILSNILDTTSIPDTIHIASREDVNITAEILYETSNGSIEGIGIHIRRQLLILSDSEGRVSIVSISGKSVSPNMFPSLLQPTAVSVDWLADRIYIASQRRIYSCPLDRDRCIVVLNNLKGSPTDIKVDPVNGYLYYAIPGKNQGLFRVDLASLPASSTFQPSQIIGYDDLWTFVVDFQNAQLYTPNASSDTVMSSFLDGSDIKNFREKVVKREFQNMRSMMYYDRAFFWTNGTIVWFEEFDPGFTQYRHNMMLFFYKSYCGLNLLHPKAQPTPVPLTSPSKVEVLFTPNRAQITWKPPQKLQYQGEGAWNHWKYDIEVKSGTKEDGNFVPYIQTAETEFLNYTADGLEYDTVYFVRIRAKSDAGTGPWSSYFVGRTMEKESVAVHVLLGVPGMIIEKDLNSLAHSSVVNFSSEARDLSWFGDLILWTTTGGDMFMFNRTNGEKTQLTNIRNAYCVAYDWLGKKIFWSEPKLGVIRRSDTKGLFPEFVYQAEARDISIDSVRGRVYWATTNSIDTAYLNGEDHMEIYSVQFFSGRQVISLVLNFDLNKVMWYVKGYDSQELYFADLIGIGGGSSQPVLVPERPAGSFHSISQLSGLQYYSHRLFWVDGVNSLVVGDLQCNYTSVVAPYNNVTSFSILHPSMQTFPVGKTEESILVIPGAIKSRSIRTVGSWSNFNLTWDAASTVNYGTLFYKLFLQIGRQQIHKTLKDAWYTVQGVSPYTQMVVSLQPYTYWGYAEPVTVSVRSPMSIPTEPQSPRVYVTQPKNANISSHLLAADFRWSSPLVSNGILSRHLVTYWQGNLMHLAETVEVSGSARHFILSPLEASEIYHFQVVACTDAGCSKSSQAVSAVTDAVKPVPMLMIAMPTGVFLSEFDSDLNATLVLPVASPSSLAYLAQDNRTFWIEKQSVLHVHQNSQQKELVEMSGLGSDLSLDWISRVLYVVEKEPNEGNSSIMGYYLDQDRYTTIITRNDSIGSVVSDPYTSTLLWTEIDKDGRGSLLALSLDTGDIYVVHSSYHRGSLPRKRATFASCSCVDLMNVLPAIAMDYTTKGQTEVVFMDATTNTIYVSDIVGCNCSIVFSSKSSPLASLPASLLAVDHMRVYWYNQREELLYSVNKSTDSKPRFQHLPRVQDIIAFGNHLQPLPDSVCLEPGAYAGTVQVLHVTNTSVQLGLERAKRPAQCGSISLPQDKYTVYYRKVVEARDGFVDCSAVPSDCLTKESYSTEIDLLELEPYTEYLIQVAVSNYYTEYMAEALSKPTNFTTKPGVPYAAEDVEAFSVTPEEIKVLWRPPRRLSGPASNVTYVIHYNTLTDQGQFIGKTENLAHDQAVNGAVNAILRDLKSNHIYNVKVQTCVTGRDMCNDSIVVHPRTFHTPGQIIFINATHEKLVLKWHSPPDNSIIRHNYEFVKVQEGQDDRWQQREIFPIFTQNDTDYVESFPNLEPNTRYQFRIMASYRTRPYPLYVWPKEQNQFIFKTMAWIPGKPSPPIARHLKTGAYEVMWEEPKDNGASIQSYILQFSAVNKSPWEIAYNGSERRWVVDESRTHPGVQYVFRVAAFNAKGWGPYSLNSTVFLAPPAVGSSILRDEMEVGIAVALCIIIVFIIVFIIAGIFCFRKRQIKKKKLLIRGPDTELATLRELPHSTFQQSNTLYGLSIIPTDEEIAKLPHVCREKLDLTQFLGSGAFGEVYEGVVHDVLPDRPGPVKCAVKTLRKSATELEKEEFLKEALLMKNFGHDHILGLLGVCLNNDPQFIIMELMEGGDLLTFLRSSRGSATSPPRLMLPDLVKICVHVAKGCNYLEDMHYVHRDLAARNCLVSTTDPRNMVVKIGDFGLARDIYKHDYYRKEGEGLLPVRWMSPESLVDGVFTTQSDIWAFGVLTWEVLTLGQQPYPARTNIEVLHFVRAGGKLERPEKCSDQMFALMQKCWSFTPDDRPCFSDLLQQLEEYRDQCDEMSAAEIALLSPTGAEGGGSLHLTPSSKKKRWLTLLDGAEKEKLIVDLPGVGRSRTSSVDSKRSSVSESSRTPYFEAQFPPVAEYDAMGYLEPRPRRVPQYLQLLNHAPELLLPAFQDARGSQNQAAAAASSAGSPLAPASSSTLWPVGPYSRAAALSGGNNRNFPSGSKSVHYASVGNQQSRISSPISSMTEAANGDRGSTASSQTYGVVSVQEPVSQVPDCEGYDEHIVVHLTDLSKLKASQRKFSDQDLYSSPAQYNQRQRLSSSTLSAASDHPYSRVVDPLSNNYSFSGTASNHTSSVNCAGRDRYPSQNGSQQYSSWVKPPSVHSNRSASESSSVFEDDEGLSCTPPPYINMQNQHSGRLRGQVFPEHMLAVASYDIAQASLV